MSKPKLIISTGPQGSGNHLWSKVFALHDEVIGWNALLDTEWIGHKDEPFNKFWENPSLFKDSVWVKDWYVTNISCPYQINGELIIPDYKSFTREAKKHFNIQFVILGRDHNILEIQEQRLRGRKTYNQLSIDWIINNYPVHFASMELLCLYQKPYLLDLSFKLGLPIAWDHPKLDAIIQENANKKYIRVAAGKYDIQARNTSGLNE